MLADRLYGRLLRVERLLLAPPSDLGLAERLHERAVGSAVNRLPLKPNGSSDLLQRHKAGSSVRARKLVSEVDQRQDPLPLKPSDEPMKRRLFDIGGDWLGPLHVARGRGGWGRVGQQ